MVPYHKIEVSDISRALPILSYLFKYSMQIQGSRVGSRPGLSAEIDHEIISTVILLPSTDSFKKGCCKIQAKVCAQSTG